MKAVLVIVIFINLGRLVTRGHVEPWMAGLAVLALVTWAVLSLRHKEKQIT